ncbi:MAG: hypothetical protein R2932_40210 [Caldilineaceae bacterium]
MESQPASQRVSQSDGGTVGQSDGEAVGGSTWRNPQTHVAAAADDCGAVGAGTADRGDVDNF